MSVVEMPEATLVRPAVEADLQALLILVHEMREESPRFRAMPWPQDRVFEVLAILVSRGWLLVAEDASPAGFMAFTLEHEFWLGQPFALERALYVRPAWRSRGVARALILEACAAAERLGAHWIDAGSTVGVQEMACVSSYGAARFTHGGFIVRKALAPDVADRKVSPAR
jgi:GNAT superfamily N-acetyltransferase